MTPLPFHSYLDSLSLAVLPQSPTLPWSTHLLGFVQLLLQEL